MRIRKRPPSSSSSSSLPFLTSLPLSADPSFPVHPPNGTHGGKHGSEGGPVQGEGLHPVGDLPVDPHEFGGNPIGRSIQDLLHSDPYPDAKGRRSSSVPVVKEVKEVKEEEEEGMMDSNKMWNAQANGSKRISGSSGVVAPGVARLGEMVLPQKKTTGEAEDELMEQEKKANAKMRASTGPASANNNCTSSVSLRDSSDKEEGCNGGGAAAVVRAAGKGSNSNGNGKRRRSPAVLMEGSRCSRVNGRGWRCCQQTLVGYSLCEHHLGKGRLRSMSSVRGQLGTSKPRWSTGARNGSVVPPTTSPQKNEEQDEEEEEEKKQRPRPAVSGDYGVVVDKIEEIEEEEEEDDESMMVRKKRKKIGMVKARSINSLLDDHTAHPVPSLSSLLSQAPEVARLVSPPHGNESSSVS